MADASPARSLPAFIAPLVRGDETAALKVLKREHPEYACRRYGWQVLLDAFEGAGGFLNGAYLVRYPREEPDDFRERQHQARYHNYIETIVDFYVRAIFSQGVNRKSANAEFDAWREDVDGANTTLDDLLRVALAMALVHGHAGVLVDKTPDAPTGPSKADEQARVIATVFTALAIPDWRFDRRELDEVKLMECAPPSSMTDPDAEYEEYQYLLWDDEGWARFDDEGRLVGADTPNLGLVPLALLQPKPSVTSPILGRALVGNANIAKAMYNRAAEEDEVLRAQAFSQLTVEVDKDGSVEDAKAALGGKLGASTALVVKGKIDFKTPDQAVPEAIRNNLKFLVQELYRAAHVRFSKDSLEAETAEAIRLQHTEMNEMLEGTADALAQLERQIARFWCAWTATDAKAAQALYEALQYEVSYPTEFFLDDLMTDLETAQMAESMNFGPTFAKRQKKRTVRRIDPNCPPEEQTKIDAEIDALPENDLLPMPTRMPPDTGDPVGQGIASAANG